MSNVINLCMLIINTCRNRIIFYDSKSFLLFDNFIFSIFSEYISVYFQKYNQIPFSVSKIQSVEV